MPTPPKKTTKPKPPEAPRYNKIKVTTSDGGSAVERELDVGLHVKFHLPNGDAVVVGCFVDNLEENALDIRLWDGTMRIEPRAANAIKVRVER